MSRRMSYSGPPGSYQMNPVRGCGTKKRGGCYLEAESSPGGTLRRLAFVLSEHTMGGTNVFVDAPSRSMVLIDPAATLLSGTVVFAGVGYSPGSQAEEQKYERLLRQIGSEFALLDHVGRAHYSPWQFVDEVWQKGPSRKVSQDFLLKVAPILPLPVFFTHPDMPVFQAMTPELMREAVDLMARALNAPETRMTFTSRPTWFDPKWGLTTDSAGDGSDHCLLPILQALDVLAELRASGSHDEEELEILYPNLIEHERFEMFLGATWFTRGSYVLEDEGDPGIDELNVFNLNLDTEEIIY